MGALNPDSKLCVLHCSKAYSGQPILQDISFTVRDGEFLSILGPSGCGKTTLLRILTGLVSPDSGTILKDGQDITHLPPDQRKIGGKIVTPMLTGSILPGITRRSCLQLLRDWGTPAEERLITVDELFEAAENGTLEEAMCVGTAAVICPIGELTYGDKVYTINNFQTGPLAQKLYDTLTGIQWGTAEDPHGWTCRL